MNLLLKEYLSSGDCVEAIRCLRELEVPHFHHELVYEAIVMVMENATEACAEMMTALLLYMYQTGIISSDQLTTVSFNFARLFSSHVLWMHAVFLQGFMRVFSDITDIVLDIPNAYHTLNKFVDRGVAAGFVSPQLAIESPSRYAGQ